MAHFIDTEDGGLCTEQFVCVLCSSGDRKLWFLRCLHSCCEGCLQNAGTSITCPECAKKTDNGAQQLRLPPNRLHDIVKTKSKLAEPQVCLLCKLFEKTNVGTYVCLECDQGHLCDQCFKIHGLHPATRSHEPIALNDLYSEENRNRVFDMVQSTPLCPDHHTAQSPQAMNYYCETCAVCACQVCLTVGHRKGTHDIVTMKEAAKKKLADLKREIKTMVVRQEAIMSQIQSTRSRRDTQKLDKEQVCNEVNDRVEALKKKLDVIGAEYIAKITRVYDEQDEADQREMKILDNTEKCSQQVVTMAQMYTSVYSVPDVVQHNVFFSECVAQAGHLPQGRTTHEKVTVKTPITDSTPDVLKDMIGQLEVETCDLLSGIGQLEVTMNDSVEDIDGQLEVEIYDLTTGIDQLEIPMDDSVADVIGQLESGKQIKVEKIQTVEVKDMANIFGLDITCDGDILVAGKMRRNIDPYIAVYNTAGQPKKHIKHNIKHVHQIAVDGEDIYIGNIGEHCVTVLDKRGVVQNTIKLVRGYSERIGVAVSEDAVYIASTYPYKLYMCLKGAARATEWAREVTSMSRPEYLCVTAKGDIAVASTNSHSLRLLNKNGQVLFTYGGHLRFPWGICSDRDSRIYIADCNNDRVVVISPTGEFIANVITREHGIVSPYDVKIWKDLLVLVHGNRKLSIFKLSTQ